MKLSLDVSYYESYVPPRCRKPRYREATGTVLCEVKELTKDAAPVACRVHDWNWRIDNGKLVATDIRHSGGRFFAPLVESDLVSARCCKNPDNRVTSDALLKYLEYRITRYGHVYDSMAEAGECAKEEAREYVVIDGFAWKVVGEPRYVINTFGLGHNHGGTGFFVEFFYNGNIPARNYFNANDEDRALKFFFSIASGRGDTESVDLMTRELETGDYRRIEVIDPSAFTCNPLEEHGDGDEFINSLEALVSSSDNVFEAGLLTMAFTSASVNE